MKVARTTLLHRTPTIVVLLAGLASLIAVGAAAPKEPAIVEALKDGSVILPVEDAQLANGATAGTLTPLAIPDANTAPAAKPCIDFKSDQSAAATWRTRLRAGVTTC